MRAKQVRISVPYIAYVMLLLGFISLGVLVASLALGRPNLALIAGVALLSSVAGSVIGFRAGTRKLLEDLGPDAHHNASIFDVPIRRDAVDRYLTHYRSGAAAGDDETDTDDETDAETDTATHDPAAEYRRAA